MWNFNDMSSRDALIEEAQTGLDYQDAREFLNEKIKRQFEEEKHHRYMDQVHIVIMRTLWDEMLDRGSQLLPKDVRMLADKLTDELEKL